MSNLVLRLVLVAAGMLSPAFLAAADPQVEPLPPQAPPVPSPGTVLTPLPFPPPSHSLPPEHGRMSVWQLYAVDRTGRFRPVVIQSPYGDYYRHDHSPYPWGTTRPLVHMPYVVD